LEEVNFIRAKTEKNGVSAVTQSKSRRAAKVTTLESNIKRKHIQARLLFLQMAKTVLKRHTTVVWEINLFSKGFSLQLSRDTVYSMQNI
jgi:hypothetical protein